MTGRNNENYFEMKNWQKIAEERQQALEEMTNRNNDNYWEMKNWQKIAEERQNALNKQGEELYNLIQNLK